jgi:hypothetical protein
MDFALWREITISVGAAVALIGLFRNLEQRKEASFREMVRDISHSESAVLRATAASQLPAYFKYRLYGFLNRPYRHQAFILALHGLKNSTEKKFVRQELAYALRNMLRERRKNELSEPNLIEACLDQLIMHDFDFSGVNLTAASLRECDLGNASFVKAKLWKADLTNSKLTSVDLSDAMLWDANFTHTDLRGATILTNEVNEHTRFDGAVLTGARVSRAIIEMCNVDAADVEVENHHQR